MLAQLGSTTRDNVIGDVGCDGPDREMRPPSSPFRQERSPIGADLWLLLHWD